MSPTGMGFGQLWLFQIRVQRWKTLWENGQDTPKCISQPMIQASGHVHCGIPSDARKPWLHVALVQGPEGLQWLPYMGQKMPKVGYQVATPPGQFCSPQPLWNALKKWSNDLIKMPIAECCTGSWVFGIQSWQWRHPQVQEHVQDRRYWWPACGLEWIFESPLQSHGRVVSSAPIGLFLKFLSHSFPFWLVCSFPLSSRTWV